MFVFLLLFESFPRFVSTYENTLYKAIRGGPNAAPLITKMGKALWSGVFL
jgi:hypothetical protein